MTQVYSAMLWRWICTHWKWVYLRLV